MSDIKKMTREEQKAYNAEYYPASVLTWLNEATDRACDSLEAENQQLKDEVAEHISLAMRTKAILDDESFWDKTSTDEGWHCSLHRDLTKACNKAKKLEDALGIYHNIIKTLEEKLSVYEDKKCETCYLFEHCITLKIGHNYDKITYCSQHKPAEEKDNDTSI